MNIQDIWKKTRDKKSLSKSEKLIFLALLFLEPFYKFGFSIVLFFKKKSTKNVSFPIISIGNISMGGTGKSVITQFIINTFKPFQGAVVMRGYKGSVAQSGKNALVHDGKKLLCSVAQSGDEACMIALQTQVPVVVGARRDTSCLLLQESNLNVDFVVLDDAYQNVQVHKDFEILLLDARWPFENNHCFPAGRLREKNYLRADCIILTHADEVAQESLENIKQQKLVDFPKEKVFLGKHKPTGIFLRNTGKNVVDFLVDKKIMLVAGVGSWQGFESSVQSMNLSIQEKMVYTNHHDYTHDDVEKIIATAKSNNLDGIITTQKDWYKLEKFLSKKEQFVQDLFFVLKIEFEFLSQQEYAAFSNLVMKVIGRKG